MLVFFWNFIAWVFLKCLSLRYKITVRGLASLKALPSAKGILFLPNHPAHMDPLIIFLLLWPRYRMHPVVVEYIFRLPLLKPLMKLVGGISIPSFDDSINQIKVKRANEAIEKIANGLKRGGNYVLYSAGRLKSCGREVLGGSSGAHAIAQECPEASLVLIRTTGLWGSSFSRALLGRTPPLPETLFKGFWTLLKSGIFFAPRRRVEIDIALAPKTVDRTGSRLAFNRALELWYNQYKDEKGKITNTEPLSLVSYSFWRKNLPTPFAPKLKEAGEEEVQISDETRAKIYAEIRRILNHPGIEISPEMALSMNLGMDSLNIAELMIFVSKSYGIEEIHPEDVNTVQNILEIAEGARGSERPLKSFGVFHWPAEKHRPLPMSPEGRTLAEAFLRVCQKMKSFAACGDDFIGVLSYSKFKLSVIVLSFSFRKIPETHIALLLPASVGTYLAILALQFAGKVPVMLNWTLGPRYLDEMLRSSGAKTVISSWRFLERISNVEFGTMMNDIRLLEDIRETISLSAKLRGWLLARRSPEAILRALKIDRIDEEAPAVVLFTSGTEASPKGVPLSHKNILSNQVAGMQCISLIPQDILYGVLPPFHSFGFSVAGLFPIFTGIRVAFYPDPTDSFAIAEGVSRWKATLFCSPPSFLKGLFNAAKEEQLKTVRMFISGAEKVPQELFNRVEHLGTGAILVEGYGITECAPILTIARANLPAVGVGQPLPNIEVCTIHLETGALLASGAEGEICVRGPNIFHGYLGEIKSPFIAIEGKQWYRTGDIGYLDKAGNLILSGRIKRFTKIGGEMVSLGGIEEVLTKELIASGRISVDVPALALIAIDKPGMTPQLVLFSTIFLGREEVNQILHHAGFSRLIKISSVKKIEEIPLMGTGKVNYRSLSAI